MGFLIAAYEKHFWFWFPSGNVCTRDTRGHISQNLPKWHIIPCSTGSSLEWVLWEELTGTTCWTAAVYDGVVLKWCQTSTSEGERECLKGTRVGFSTFPIFLGFSSLLTWPARVPRHADVAPSPAMASLAPSAEPFPSSLCSKAEFQCSPFISLLFFFFFIISSQLGFVLLFMLSFFLRIDQIKVIFYLNGKEQ